MAHLPKCPTCDGQGRVIVVRESTMYACGYVQEARTCPACRGCRILAPKPTRLQRVWARIRRAA